MTDLLQAITGDLTLLRLHTRMETVATTATMAQHHRRRADRAEGDILARVAALVYEVDYLNMLEGEYWTRALARDPALAVLWEDNGNAP